jgi:hypothetical protein
MNDTEDSENQKQRKKMFDRSKSLGKLRAGSVV